MALPISKTRPTLPRGSGDLAFGVARPNTRSIAGRVPGFDNAWMIATHSGVTLGPLLGRLIAEEIVDGASHAALAPFRPERFATAS